MTISCSSMMFLPFGLSIVQVASEWLLLPRHLLSGSPGERIGKEKSRGRLKNTIETQDLFVKNPRFGGLKMIWRCKSGHLNVVNMFSPSKFKSARLLSQPQMILGKPSMSGFVLKAGVCPVCCFTNYPDGKVLRNRLFVTNSRRHCCDPRRHCCVSPCVF